MLCSASDICMMHLLSVKLVISFMIHSPSIVVYRNLQFDKLSRTRFVYVQSNLVGSLLSDFE